MDSTYSRWINGEKILSTKGFPSCTSLRFERGRETGRSLQNCSCGQYSRHADALDFLKEVVRPWMGEAMKGRENPFPKVEVCYNTSNLWVDTIPSSISHHEKAVKFEELETIAQVESVLSSCTYWYRRLRSSKNGRSRLARALLRMIACESGFNDHKMKDSFLLTLKPKKAGFNRLRNVLATTDGMLIQLMLSFPEHPKMWEWSTYDQIMHCMISNLIPDYCSPNKEKTAFAAIKSLRQEIKKEGFDPSGDLKNVSQTRRFSFLVPLLKSVGNSKSPWNMTKVSMLSQTRASGVPPPSIKLAAVAKWVSTVLTPSDPELANRISPDIIQAVDDFYDEAVRGVSEEHLETFFRKCMKSAKISLSDSAELNVPVSEGGKLEAVRRQLTQLGRVTEIDLETGKDTGNYFTVEDGGIGEMIFHDTLRKWRDDGPYSKDKMSIRVSTVPELGKYRTITVSSIEHAVLLHPWSHMTLEFFAAYAPTSAGVKASNQAWEFFRRLSHENPNAGFIFDKENTFVHSTDWSQSTDWVDHYIARILLGRFNKRFGVPSWYGKMCMFALTAPRMVLEPLNEEGKPWLTKRAVLMGDPGTKSLLTLYHPVARFLALRCIRSLNSDE